MALQHSPSIVTSGLILCVDAGNPRSYSGSGTTWADVSSTGNNGTLTNGPTFTGNGVSSYFTFDGVNDYWVSPTSTAFDTQTLTLESWVYPTTLLQNGFLFEKGAVNTQYSHFFNGDGTFYFRTMGLSSQDITFTSSSNCTANAWNHIVSTYGSGTKITYVNGVIASSASGLTGTIATGQTNQYIGAFGAGVNYFLNGRIGITRVYNIALSQPQVLQNFNAFRGRYGI
jgi:hypothetical protein